MNKGILLLAWIFLFSSFSFADGIVAEIKENVGENWEDISEWCDEVMALRKRLPTLPRSSWFFTDQGDLNEEIHEGQAKIKELLLSADSRKLLKEIYAIDKKLSKLRAEQEELREEKVFYPKRGEKLDREIAELEDECKGLLSRRVKEVGKIRQELESIGLKFKGDSIDSFITLVNREDFINNVIVARTVYDIVENLKNAMSDGNVVSATRYYGIYVVLMDVQISCYEAYLEKSRHGEWAHRLNALSVEVDKTIANCQTNIVSGLHDEVDCEGFKRLITENQKVLTAISIYKKLLACYEDGIEKRLEKAKLRREKAKCAFETASNVLSFAALAFETQSDYTALMELELPEFKEFSSDALDEQLRSITTKLDMAGGK
jgi:predicted  nucleic acid-binding Zn-ribbon protein